LTRALEGIEAKRNIEQADRIEHLTKLAFFFLPLSFTASIFGMNIKEIQTSNPPVWAFFVVSLGTLGLAYIPLRFSDIRKFWKNMTSKK